MSKGCTVCHGWHAAGGTDEDCGHWCHFAGAEDWDEPRAGDGQEATDG